MILFHSNRTIPIGYLLALFWLLFAQSPMAYAAQWYHVEIVVFEQLHAVSDEVAPERIVPPASLTPNSSNDAMRPASVSSLNGEATRLKNAGAYRVLSHQAWQQPIQTKSNAQSVNISNQFINGRVRLHKGTYLYATLDIQLQQLSLEGQPYLQQAQRIRSKKTHYFDHPKMGALLKITPL